MCGVLSAACADAEARRQEAAAAAAAANGDGGAATSAALEQGLDASPRPIAAVFGAAHLPGLRRLWESGEWRALLAAGGSGERSADGPLDAAAALLLASSPLLSAPEVDPSSLLTPQAGARRGLLEALLAESVTDEVLADLDGHLLPIPPLPTTAEPGGAPLSSPEDVLRASLSAPHPATAARAWSREIYGTFRMKLAALPIELLDGFVSSWPEGGEAGLTGAELPPEARSAWGLLAPLRALRPTYGGPGWDAAVGLRLRQLDYELGAPDGGGEAGEDVAGSEASAGTTTTTAADNFFQDVV